MRVVGSRRSKAKRFPVKLPVPPPLIALESRNMEKSHAVIEPPAARAVGWQRRMSSSPKETPPSAAPAGRESRTSHVRGELRSQVPSVRTATASQARASLEPLTASPSR